ncbi:MAG: Trp biosynthesis-associated membrane protein [Actinomycetota bacterium]|nr:Trp biosynthesis-associated membrane protein [Actinomycetota bacterium]
MTARRELALAVGLCLLGAAVVLLAAGRPWTRFTLDQGGLLPPLRLAPSGRSLDPTAGALGLVGLAGVLALAATRRRGRLVVGVLVALAGAVVVVSSLRVASAVLPAVRRSGALDRAGAAASALAGPLPVTAWPWVSAAGGLLLALAGLLVVVRGPAWAALSARYEAPERRAAAGEVSLWEALDRGDDPT